MDGIGHQDIHRTMYIAAALEFALLSHSICIYLYAEATQTSLRFSSKLYTPPTHPHLIYI